MQQQQQQQREEKENTHRKCRTRTVSAFAMLLLLLTLQTERVRAEEESQDFQKNSKYHTHTYLQGIDCSAARLKWRVQSKPLQIMFISFAKKKEFINIIYGIASTSFSYAKLSISISSLSTHSCTRLHKLLPSLSALSFVQTCKSFIDCQKCLSMCVT